MKVERITFVRNIRDDSPVVEMVLELSNGKRIIRYLPDSPGKFIDEFKQTLESGGTFTVVI